MYHHAVWPCEALALYLSLLHHVHMNPFTLLALCVIHVILLDWLRLAPLLKDLLLWILSLSLLTFTSRHTSLRTLGGFCLVSVMHFWMPAWPSVLLHLMTPADA